MVNSLNKLPKPFLVLAPMDDVSDSVFRQIVATCAAPDLFFTEFVNVDGLMSSGRPKLLKKLRFAASEKSLIVQLWGLNPANFRAVAAQIADGSLARELGLPTGCNFVGVDLNMGCPAKGEVKNGTCSALINNRPLAATIIAATREGLAGRLPLSVKTRVGFSAVDMDWLGFLLGQNLQMLTIHGRTRQEMSKVPANWDLIGKAREMRDELAPATLIVGNGDVVSHAHALELAERYQLDGVMIGRGVFHDPYVFSPEAIWETTPRAERLDLYRRHVQLFTTTWRDGERAIQTLNKFCKVYVNGFDGAKELREVLMPAGSTAELLSILDANLALEAAV